MLRKLIMFAITSGLAKKAWDSYRGQGRGMADAGGTGRGRASGKPVVRAKTAKYRDGRPDAG